MSVCRQSIITPARAAVIAPILTTTIQSPPSRIAHPSSTIAHTRLAARHASLPPAEPRQTTRDTETQRRTTHTSFPVHPSRPHSQRPFAGLPRTPPQPLAFRPHTLYIRAAAPLVVRCAVPGLPGASIHSSHRTNFAVRAPSSSSLWTSHLTLRAPPSRFAYACVARSLSVVVPSLVSPMEHCVSCGSGRVCII
ncbi:hypothetical protein C8Q79DRAFT_276644 [Trametes meyenii]|nr:hypothetical protein C8Q79DRAFT_276644 [Trametes meyenii]